MIADLTLTCAGCSQEFLFSAEEQGFYQGQGFKSAPKRCRGCRRARKTGEGSAAASRSEGRGPRRPPARASYQATCSGCGASTHVPFEPDPMRPAFCRTCFQSRRRRH
jgi:CxxC-x17-CxxC domain-containing protein